MLSQLKQQDIDLWEAWIEYDQFNPENFGTLYVIGEIMVDHLSAHADIEKNCLADSRQLVLKVPARPTGRSRTKEILYSEPIQALDQYTAICIYASGELIASFEEIEVFV